MQSATPDIPREKAALRTRMRAALRAVLPDERAAASAAICEALRARPEGAAGVLWAAFASMPTEPSLWPLLGALWAAGRVVALPRVVGAELTFHAVASEADLQRGSFGLLEPVPARCRVVAPGELGVLLVPGLAFGRDGTRLGQGGGFYDRWLAGPARPPHVWGVAFALQCVEAVPAESHDSRVDAVLTEVGAAFF